MQFHTNGTFILAANVKWLDRCRCHTRLAFVAFRTRLQLLEICESVCVEYGLFGRQTWSINPIVNKRIQYAYTHDDHSFYLIYDTPTERMLKCYTFGCMQCVLWNSLVDVCF